MYIVGGFLWSKSGDCYTMVLFCNLLDKEGDLGGVMASCGELDKSPAMEQESTTIKDFIKGLLTIKGWERACYVPRAHKNRRLE